MFKIFIQARYPTLRSSPYMSRPSHSYHTINSNDMLLPYPRVEAIRMIFRCQLIKVWREFPESIKCQRSYPMFKIALTEFYLSQCYYMRQPLNPFLGVLSSIFYKKKILNLWNVMFICIFFTFLFRPLY